MILKVYVIRTHSGLILFFITLLFCFLSYFVPRTVLNSLVIRCEFLLSRMPLNKMVSVCSVQCAIVHAVLCSFMTVFPNHSGWMFFLFSPVFRMKLVTHHFFEHFCTIHQNSVISIVAWKRDQYNSVQKSELLTSIIKI